eukprot:1965910-Prymnesium_polylepis.1
MAFRRLRERTAPPAPLTLIPVDVRFSCVVLVHIGRFCKNPCGKAPKIRHAFSALLPRVPRG